MMVSEKVARQLERLRHWQKYVACMNVGSYLISHPHFPLTPAFSSSTLGFAGASQGFG